MVRYIDADKLKKDMSHQYLTKGYFYVSTALECIDDVPTADVQEVMHGHWVREVTEIEDTYYFKAFCSVCNRRSIVKYKFCPHCGAKMDEEEQK